MESRMGIRCASRRKSHGPFIARVAATETYILFSIQILVTFFFTSSSQIPVAKKMDGFGLRDVQPGVPYHTMAPLPPSWIEYVDRVQFFPVDGASRIRDYQPLLAVFRARNFPDDSPRTFEELGHVEGVGHGNF